MRYASEQFVEVSRGCRRCPNLLSWGFEGIGEPFFSGNSQRVDSENKLLNDDFHWKFAYQTVFKRRRKTWWPIWYVHSVVVLPAK